MALTLDFAPTLTTVIMTVKCAGEATGLTAANVAVLACVIVDAYALPGAEPTAQISVRIDADFLVLPQPPEEKGLLLEAGDLHKSFC